jgi:tRNA A-37 threonylcarbamoyl transferase component Bud32
MPETQETWEDGYFAVTFERKYYHRGGSFIKRSLRPKELPTGYRGLHIPRFRKESLMNEAASLRYIRQHTVIPVPTVYFDFEDDDAYYLITEYVEGVSMSRLTEDQKAAVCEGAMSQRSRLSSPTDLVRHRGL